MSKEKIPVAVAFGDGIGPEIMQVTLDILEKAQAPIEKKIVNVGEKVYLSGERKGIHHETWDILRSCKAFLKAPITTPQGGGYKSLNVTIRTSFGLFANIRPCVSYSPFVPTKHPGMDVVIVRENEEDLYTGIEYRPTQDVRIAHKLISEQGCQKIIRAAFEYAISSNRKKVTCFTKDNILKMTDGLFHHLFEEIGKEYPQIEKEHWIVDIGAAKLADTPEHFDVVVLPNLYGDILSDVAAQIAGSVGMAGSANIGEKHAMFEAIHGSAPRQAGKNTANPSGLLLASIMMLVYLKQHEIAALIHNAWLRTLEDGVHTHDISKGGPFVGTLEFGKAVIKRLGQNPKTFSKIMYADSSFSSKTSFLSSKKQEKELVGADIFIEHENAASLLSSVQQTPFSKFHLEMIANRGVQIYPHFHPETFCIDEFRCRFMKKEKPLNFQDILELLTQVHELGLKITRFENLFTYDGKPGFSVSIEKQ